MRVYSLDSIVRNTLLQRGYPIHWYMEFLIHAVNCLRTLHFDDLRVINTVKLNVNDYSAIDIPADCVEVVGVGVQYGQKIRNLVPDGKINPLHNRDNDCKIIPYGNDDDGKKLVYGLFPVWPSGSLWQGAYIDGFKVLPERGQIQLDENIGYDSVILQYISDGTCIDSLTCVDPLAKDTIDAYIKWQQKENSRIYSEGEKQRAQNFYTNQRKILRARKNPLTTDLVRRIFNKSATAGQR